MIIVERSIRLINTGIFFGTVWLSSQDFELFFTQPQQRADNICAPEVILDAGLEVNENVFP